MQRGPGGMTNDTECSRLAAMSGIPPTDEIAYPAPDPARPYVYPGTTVLINLFGIRDAVVHDRVAGVVAGLRGAEFDRLPATGDFDLAHFCAIHRHLFQDIYAWAGVPRSVNTMKSTRTFVPAAMIAERFALLHDRLREADYFRGLDTPALADRLVAHYLEIYAIHPFREGNSRTLRHYCQRLAAAAGHRLDFSAVPVAALVAAGRQAQFAGDATALRAQFLRAMAGA